MGVMHTLLDDPWVAAQVDAAIAPYVGKLSETDLAWMRDQLAETLAEDAYAASLVRRAHPRVSDQSGFAEGGDLVPRASRDTGTSGRGPSR